MEKFYVTTFEVPKPEAEYIPSDSGLIAKKKPIEPSIFTGKTKKLECSGQLIDLKDLIDLVKKAKNEAIRFRIEAKSSIEYNAHVGAEFAFESILKELYYRIGDKMPNQLLSVKEAAGILRKNILDACFDSEDIELLISAVRREERESGRLK